MRRSTEIILVLLLIALAGLLRMGWPGLTEFKADEARLLALALEMREGQFALRGISSSVGFPNFPASVWVYTLPLLVWPHVTAATIFTGLLNTLAAAACYWFVRRYWGPTAALAATLLLVVSPWAILFSRKIWAQNLLPLFVMGWGVGAALAFVERRPRYIWLHLVSLALAVQIHLAAVGLAPATLLLLLFFRRRIVWRDLLVGGALAAATAVPFLVYLWQTWRQSGALPALGGAASGALTLDALRFTAMLSLGKHIHSLAGPEAFRAFLARAPNLTPVYWLWGALILAGVARLFWLLARRRETRQAEVGLIVLLWLLAPPLFFLWHNTPVFVHYLIATLPAQYVAAGVAFAALLPRPAPLAPRPPLLATALITGLIATALAQLWVWASLLNFVAMTNTPGAFGTPLAMKLEMAATAKALLAESGAAEALAVGLGEAPGVDAFPAEMAVLLRDVAHRFVDGDHSAVFPAQPAVVIVDERGDGVWAGEVYRAAATAARVIPLRAGEGQFRVLALPGAAKPAPAVAFDPPYLLANWVNLTGYDAPKRLDGETAVWRIHWRTGDNPDPAAYHFFNHLVDEEGLRIGQADAAAFTPAQWRAGDSVISRFALPWPAETPPPLTMRVGMYRYPSLENAPLLDVAANPYADAAEIELEGE